MNPVEELSPTGPAWAAIIAAAIGCACFGLLVDLSEAFKGVSRALSFYKPSGDLSGKSTLAVVGWLIAWAILRFRWKNRNIQSPGRLMIVCVVLLVLSLLATFPAVFGLFAAQ
jgi:hypothetical protein